MDGVELVGAMFVARTFAISYEKGGICSTRFADVEGWCAQRSIPAREYSGTGSIAEFAAECRADFALVAGWYHMIPRQVRERFPKGCAGFHGSLLPKFRGGAPLAWAILAGEAKTGMTLFELGDGIDDGGVYGQREIPIGARTSVGELVALAQTAAIELLDCLPRISAGELRARPQEGAPSYALQRSPRDGVIDWTRSTGDIDRLIRAVGHPYPGASTTLSGSTVLVWSASPHVGPRIYGTPGQIARLRDESETCVVTGDGALVIHDATNADGQSVLAELRRAANQRLL